MLSVNYATIEERLTALHATAIEAIKSACPTVVTLSWIQNRLRVGFNLAEDIKRSLIAEGVIAKDGKVLIDLGPLDDDASDIE